MKQIIFSLAIVYMSSIVGAATDKITDVKTAQDAMVIYNELKAQGSVVNIGDIIKDNQGDLKSSLKDIQLKTITGYPNEKNLFRVISISKGSIYEKKGIKAGDLVKSN